ncbi:MAG: oligosaccharide flippase family protein [Candidatus Binatia bacterium]
MTRPDDATALHRQARESIRLMLSRRMLILLLTFASGIVLARTLTPSDFGLFAVAFFVTTVARMLAELGFSQVLIQRPGALEPHMLQTAFTIQQAVSVLAFVALWPLAAWVPHFYPQLSGDLVALIRVLSLQLLVLAWADMSETILERSLSFERLAPIEVLGSVTYNATTLTLALAGYGVWSLAYGSVIATVVRAGLAYRAAPWPVRLRIDRSAADVLWRRGLTILVGRMVTQGQYWVTPTLVAGTIGPAATGLLQWAAGNGKKPIEVLESAVRVSLPHFSQLQHDGREVERILARYVTAFALVCALWLVVLALAGADLVALVYGARWVPAATAMTLFAAAGLLVSGGVIVTTALIGLGRMAFATRIGTCGAAVTLLASAALVLMIGPLGVPIGQLAGAALTLPWLVSGLGPGAFGRVIGPARAIVAPAAVALVVGTAVRYAGAAALGDSLAPGFRGLLTAGTMTLAYLATAWWYGPEWLRRAARGEALPSGDAVAERI